MRLPRTSVIIPTWNRRALLARAIDSVLAQTAVPDEIIVVDDGSTDGTERFVRARYPFVRFLRQSNAGVSAARNAGLDQAGGEWIALLDSDDEWLPDKLRSQHKLLALRADLKVCHTEEIWVRNGVRVNPMRKHAKPEGNIFLHCLPLCCVSPSSVVLHRSVIDRVGVFDERLPACEDYDMWLRVFSRFEAGLVSEPMLNKFGGHDDQLSRRHWGMDRFRVQALDKLLRAGELDDAYRPQVIAALKQKCAILIGGAEKRRHLEEADRYRTLAAAWR